RRLAQQPPQVHVQLPAGASMVGNRRDVLRAETTQPLRNCNRHPRSERMARIAVIGAGISGMAAAYFLSRKNEVSLFEREDRLGGHTHTHRMETSVGTRAIDTGFIVYNEKTYPNLTRLFRELRLETINSDMSFGVSCPGTGFEYSSRGLAGFFADK